MSLELAVNNKNVMEFFKNLSTQEEVVENLNKLDIAYYNGKPLIPDVTYDTIRSYVNMRFPELRTKVGKKEENSVWPKVSLEIPMGSLEKENDLESLEKWYKKYTSGSVVGSNKVDGSSVELSFLLGNFNRGVTRGDGFVGDDITPNARKMKFPKKISTNASIKVRGEIVLLNSDFNMHFAPNGDKNPRNSAAGAARRLDGKGCEHLTVIAFDIISDEIEFKTKYDKFAYLEKLGFVTPNYVLLQSFENVQKVVSHTNDIRKSIPYMIDGLVFEDNNLENFELQGIVDNRPRAARAFKFESECAESTMLDVVWQVGKHGTITPVGLISPTDLQGATFNRVMLNNLSHIEELGMEIGSKFVLSRRNDVIPKAEKVLTKTGNKIVPPYKCPSCGSILNTNDTKHIICENHEECPAQGSYRIVAFLKVLGVNGLGDKIIDKLLDNGIISDCADLFTLDIDKASEIEGISKVVLQKSYKDLVQKSQKVTLPKFIKSVSIKHIGESATEKVMSTYPTVNDLFNMDYNTLINIDGIGESIASDFIMGMNSKKDLIMKLLRFITISSQAEGPFSGMVFCFTGFRGLESKVEELGGTMSASVTKATTHLVCANTSSMSTKAQKAQKDGKTVISKDDLVKMIEEHESNK